MSHPVIAIIGRPNVGKSRLFNRLTGKYQALVDNQPGVTRDRHYGLVEWRGATFMAIDTGGLIPGAEEPLNKKVWEQAFEAIKEADFLICLFSVQEGLNPVDEALVKELRKAGKPIFFVVNKVDRTTHESDVFEFNKVGARPLFPVSAEHGRGISDLLEAIYEKLPKEEKPPEFPEEAMRLAIIGRPNVGKSTLINQMLGQERVVVHDEAGTTRDAIDILVEREGKQFVVVDTAGIKKKSATRTRLEKFSVIQSLRAIDDSQCVCLLLDATQGITHQDLQLAHTIWEQKKGLLILVNKWDLMKGNKEKYLEDLRPQLRELHEIPVMCISAKTGKQCEEIWNSISAIYEAMQKRLSTPKLNQWLKKVAQSHPLPLYKGKTVKLYYAAQVGISPPHIVLFSNLPQGVPETYRRYLIHQLQDELDIKGIPIHLTFRRRESIL
ncbi:MAG: ribosome biogenesis GTPase Der [Deltaproteobacteria bacterium RIFCSPLOWO2_02_FULL_46_8]|nr:MAG: ribosome biogenesis GTPase Der [Deltaproteobacteria bacterium RIFCSPLOWO2_02_FULL_46_8]